MFKVNCLKENYFPSVFILLLSLGVLTGFYGCGSSENEDITFFGGKIKNPKGKYVYLSKEKKVIDSARLDDHNKFAFELDSIKARSKAERMIASDVRGIVVGLVVVDNELPRPNAYRESSQPRQTEHVGGTKGLSLHE